MEIAMAKDYDMPMAAVCTNGSKFQLGDVISSLISRSRGSGNSSGSGIKDRNLSENLPDKLKHWSVVVSGGNVISMNGKGYLIKEHLSELSDTDLVQQGDQYMAQAAEKLYNEYVGRQYTKYILFVNDCQTFITDVITKADNLRPKAPATNVLGTIAILTGANGLLKACDNANTETLARACAWANKAETNVGKSVRSAVAMSVAPYLTVCKIPGYIWAQMKPSNW